MLSVWFLRARQLAYFSCRFNGAFCFAAVDAALGLNSCAMGTVDPAAGGVTVIAVGRTTRFARLPLLSPPGHSERGDKQLEDDNGQQ